MPILGNDTRNRKYGTYSLREFTRVPIPCPDLETFSVGERFVFEGIVLKTV